MNQPAQSLSSGGTFAATTEIASGTRFSRHAEENESAADMFPNQKDCSTMAITRG
jgi:hypothetical protein